MKKLIIALALVLGTTVVTASSAHAATISGNGNKSYNKIVVKEWSLDKKVQENEALQGNLVGVQTNSGDNTVKNNTGKHGDNMVTTGDSTVDTTITNAANLNILKDDCGCQDGSHDHKAVIKNNGNKSTNKIYINDSDTKVVKQENTAVQLNGVFVSTNTGGNTVKNNTGGTNTVDTGDSTVNTTVTNLANVNVIH